MGRLQTVMNTVWMRTRGRGLPIPLRRCAAWAVAAAVLLGSAGISASGPPPVRDEGNECERFGEIHWCQTKSSPPKRGAFLL